jgi:hypothetical protein
LLRPCAQLALDGSGAGLRERQLGRGEARVDRRDPSIVEAARERLGIDLAAQIGLAGSCSPDIQRECERQQSTDTAEHEPTTPDRERALELVEQFEDTRVPLLGLIRETSPQRSASPTWKPGRQPSDRSGRHRCEPLAHARRRERPLTRQRLDHAQAQRELIPTRGSWLAAQLLGRHVCRGPDHRTASCQGARRFHRICWLVRVAARGQRGI